MKKVISYNLFEPKKLYEHRSWDADNKKKDRYFYNIPALAIANTTLYPDFQTHITVCPKTEKNHLFQFYKELCERDNRFSYSVNHSEYSGHDAASWRIALLWDEDYETVLIRDLDSIPNTSEFKATKFFNKSVYSVYTMRSHEIHYQYPCRMLIGLSGFKPIHIPLWIIKESFEDFQKDYGDPNKWDGDQVSLIKAFTTDEFFTSENFLDCRINDQKHFPDFYCNQVTEDDLQNVEIDKEQKALLDLVETHGLTQWAGEPSDARGQFLVDIIKEKFELSEVVSTIVKSDKKLKDFYLK